MGGKHPGKSFLPASESPKSALPREDLAQVHCCTIVKNIDCRSGMFQIQHLPRLRMTTAEDEMIEFGKVLQSCVVSQDGCPPISVAMDCHGSFNSLHMLFLGLLKPSEYSHVPMLGDCRRSEKALKAPLWCFRHIIYLSEEKPIFGCADPKHILKAVCRSLRTSSRTLQMLLAI